jgi:hypothetical protein
MFLRVDTAAGRSELCDADDLQRLSVQLDGGDDAAATSLALASFGRLDGEHAWLRVDALREAGPDDPAWRQRFDAMIDFAGSKGWTDDAGAVRAHIER